MTDEEWDYYQAHKKAIKPLGVCSRLLDGRIKIEGYLPCTDDELIWVVSTSWPAEQDRLLKELRAL